MVGLIVLLPALGVGVECYDRGLAAELDSFVDGRIAAARPIDVSVLAAVPLPARLRNAAARLLAPYL